MVGVDLILLKCGIEKVVVVIIEELFVSVKEIDLKE